MLRHVLAALLAFALAPSAFAWGGPPDWLKELARAPLPSYPDDTPGVALLDETITTVSASGEVRTKRRAAFRILSSEGRDLAYIAVPFDQQTKLLDLRAWGLTASGAEMKVKERDAVETAQFDGELYSDKKLKVLRMPGAEPGNVVAFEYEQLGRPYGLQDVWYFQSRVPVRRARYALSLPAGWKHEAVWFNATGAQPQAVGEQTTWELTDVEGMVSEPGMPALRAISGRMAVRFVPPDGVLTSRVHRTWSDVARWFDGLAASRVAASPAVQAKAKELVAGKTSTIDKIRALAAFAQHDVRYVAIEIGIGGYQPHAADDVFAKRYGDCKDKVTLLIAMLRAVGLDAHYVIVNTDRGVAAKDFPSHLWFNHVIAAIRVSDDDAKSLHATSTHPKLGRLLYFDPTSTSTPLGLLPTYLQENSALLVHSNGGEMVDLGVHPADANRLVRSAKLTLSDDGGLAGEVREVRTGAIAARLRDSLQSMTEAERQRWVESSLSYHLTQSTVRELAIENLDDPSKDLVVRYKVSAPKYAKTAGGMLLVRPRVLGSKGEGMIELDKRKRDYVTDGPAVHVDEIDIVAPAGLVADELPKGQSVTTPTVSYTSASKFESGTLHYRREYKVHRFHVPLANVPELNGVYSKILADERTSAVFVRK